MDPEYLLVTFDVATELSGWSTEPCERCGKTPTIFRVSRWRNPYDRWLPFPNVESHYFCHAHRAAANVTYGVLLEESWQAIRKTVTGSGLRRGEPRGGPLHDLPLT